MVTFDDSGTHDCSLWSLDMSLISLCILLHRSKALMAMSTAYHGDANDIIA